MPDNRDTLFRQWAMLRHIPRYPQTVSTRQIVDYLAQEDFSVTNRTVERDLDKLSAIFGYSSEEHGRSNHWFWPGNFGGIDIPGLEPNTALAFNLAELHLKDLLPPSTLDLLAPYFERARNVLDVTPGRSLINWRDKIKVIGTGPQLAAPVIDSDIQRVMYNALLHERRVDIQYQPRTDSSTKEYQFSPLGLVSRQGVLYLVGPLWEYENVVQLALHRIKIADPIDASSHRPTGFDLASYVSHAREFSYPTGEGYIDMVIAMDERAALHLLERPLSPGQHAETQTDGRIRLAATVLDTDELTWWLLGFGAAAEVLAPRSLRDRVQAALETAISAYRPG
ncbi:helix-turn-helix transcriptional regulator [Salinisphaera aquimarina]|uniref:Helix-turn-helix transcriptional regulator n=1 Tax=Salinisphaera aquimarina TaxID=2094031 RepID=A0ABV7ET85_9GAMM